jgi:hypothetical protein
MNEINISIQGPYATIMDPVEGSKLYVAKFCPFMEKGLKESHRIRFQLCFFFPGKEFALRQVLL